MTMTEAAEVPRTSIGPEWHLILEMGALRQEDNSVLIDEIRDIQARYNGDIVYPWADKLNEDVDPLTPHLIGESIDAYGMRAAGVPLDIVCPPLYPGVQSGRGSRAWADVRREAVAATLHKNRWPLLRAKFFRHLAGYGTTTLIVTPDFRSNMPRLQVINPLNAFPDPRSPNNFADPEDLIIVNGYSAKWMRKNFPMVREENGGPIPRNEYDGELWDLLTYMDEDVVVVGLAGRRTDWMRPFVGTGGSVNSRSMELSRIENRAGMVTGISMGRVTLDRLTTALKHVTGQVDWAAKLQLLEIEAAEKSIFPDLYMMTDGSRAPRIHSGNGEWKDGRTGQINIISDAQAIGQMRSTPDPAGNQAIDRLERNSRVSLGLAAQWGGETSNALRTGRGIETMLAASTDPRIMEMHQVALAWLPVIGESILKVWREYWPDTKHTMYSGYSTGNGSVEFEPSKHFSDSTEVVFSYPIAGGDIQLTNIVLLQQLGAEAISLDTFRRKHPWIDDPVAEGKRVNEEQLEKLAFQALMQQAMGGEIPLEQLAMIEAEFRDKDNADIFTAIRGAAEKLRARQAEEAPPAPEGMASAPEMMPGIGGPTGPAAAPEQAGPIAPPQGIEGLRELQNALAAGGRRVNGVVGPQ